MIAFSSDLKILVASRPIDFRRGVNGLVALVAEALGANPYSGAIYVFRAKRSDRLKMITWDGSGMVMATKWLEEGSFAWPPEIDGAVSLSAAQVTMLVAGLNWKRVVEPEVKRPILAA
jgi:transposase